MAKRFIFYIFYLQVIYKGPARDKRIYLWLQDSHYHVIKKMNAFLGHSYYCGSCDTGYDKKTKHRCPNTCPTCFSSNCQKEQSVECQDCHRSCRSFDCYNRHKEVGAKKKSFCDQLGLCTQCKKIFEKSNPHVCGQAKCQNCKKNVITAEHLCFMTVKPVSKCEDKYIFFDFETQQDSGCHEVNLAIAHYMNGTERIFSGPRALQNFGDFIFSDQHKHYCLLAHNMSGFDGLLLLSYIISQSVKPQVILNGSKILSIVHPKFNVRVIDSFSFIPMALSKMPKTFGLDELKKGYFPHLFNTK